MDIFQWMSSFWQTDPCYAASGVDGSRSAHLFQLLIPFYYKCPSISRCSFIIYLSEIETNCPVMPFRMAKYSANNTTAPVVEKVGELCGGEK